MREAVVSHRKGAHSGFLFLERRHDHFGLHVGEAVTGQTADRDFWRRIHEKHLSYEVRYFIARKLAFQKFPESLQGQQESVSKLKEPAAHGTQNLP